MRQSLACTRHDFIDRPCCESRETLKALLFTVNLGWETLECFGTEPMYRFGEMRGLCTYKFTC